MKNAFFIFCLALAPSDVVAQGQSLEPPLANRPAQFSNVIGAFAIDAKAQPLEVPVEEPITLRVTITSNGPARVPPDRKHLKLFPHSWSRDFYVEPAPEEDRHAPDDGQWVFVYRLRPKHEQVGAIDGIKLVYYQPPRGKIAGKYQTARAEPIAISVKPRPSVTVPENLAMRTAPASFYELPDTSQMLTTWEWTLPPPLWLVLNVLLGPPLVCVTGVFGCRRAFGSRDRLQRSRSAAARRALQALSTGDAEAWMVLSGYLRERLGYPAVDATPVDARRFVRKYGVSRALAEQLAACVAACDAVRFGGPATLQSTLNEEATRVIQALEDDLCAP